MSTFPKKKKDGGYRPIFRNIFVLAKKEFSPFATTFVFSPENIEQQGLGTLFGIIKIDDLSEDSSYVANLITSIIKKEYFSKPQRSAEESFEVSLRKANLALAELVRHGSTGWAGKINFTGGSLERNNLHFACLGKVSAFLVRRGQIAEIGKELEEEKEIETHPLKTFSNISSGKLEMGDKLIFATGELSEIFSSEELRQNALHFSQEEFPGFLELSLQANSELAGTIVVDLMDAAKIQEATVTAPLIGEEKIKKINTFAETSITPMGDDRSEAEMRQASPSFLRSDEEYRPSGSQGLRAKSFLDALKKIFTPLKTFFQNVLSFLSGINIRDKFSRLNIQFAKDFFNKAGIFATRLAGHIRKADLKSKKTLATGIFIVLLIGGAVVLSAVRKNQNESTDASEANDAVEISSVQQQPADINAKNIEAPELFATFSQNVNSLAIMDGIPYGASAGSVLRIDPQSKDITDMPSNIGGGNFKLISSMPDLGSLFILTDGKKIISLTPINKNYQENSITTPDNAKIADMRTYLTYVYFLDPVNNQIYRYPRAEGGFGEMQNWLRNSSDIKNAKGFAINDDIFVATGNEIFPYLQGKIDSSVSFQKPIVGLSIDRIYTEPGFNGIYVLDNMNHRIVQYDKQGKIVSQYFSDSISGVKDLIVDEKNKTGYLLKNNQLLKFSID